MNEKNKGYLYLAIGGIFWGCSGVFISLLSQHNIDSLTTAFLNLSSSALFLGIVVLVALGPKAFRISRNALGRLIITGFVSEFLYDICYINSVRMVGVSLAAILLYTSPIFTCILSAVFFKEKINSMKLLSVLINIIGCVLAVTGGDFSSVSGSLSGILLGVAAGFLYALVTIIGKFNAGIADPKVISFYNFFFGMLFMLPLSNPWLHTAEILSLPILPLGLCCGSLGAGLPYILYMMGVAKPIEASKAPVFASTEPVTAVILGAVLFSEKITFISVIGIVLILVSIALINSKKASEE